MSSAPAMQPRLGAHMSIAGGLPNAIDRGVANGCDAIQIFTKSSSQWRARPLDAEEVREFRSRAERSGIGPIVAHATYLINLASGATVLRDRSIAAYTEELDRADALGLLGVVLHPGAYTVGTEADGLRLIGEALRGILASRPLGRAMILLEHTAGQGTALGHRFEHLALLLDYLEGSPRAGVCLDTCHLVAAGYDIGTEAGYREVIANFDATVGLDRLKVVHLNDSKKPCGSRVDRHEHIGKGCLGEEPFRRLLRDARLAHLPMVLETPKAGDGERGPIQADRFDLMNLRLLRELAGDVSGDG